MVVKSTYLGAWSGMNSYIRGVVSKEFLLGGVVSKELLLVGEVSMKFLPGGEWSMSVKSPT